MSSPIVSAFQPGIVGTSIARLVLPHADGNAAAMYFDSPCRVGQLEDQHVLGQPAVVAGHHRGDAQARSTSCRAGRCRRSPSRTTRSRGSRGSARCTCCRGCTATARRPGRGSSGAPTECTHGTQSPSPEHVERGLAHAGHDPHADRDVGGVGELHADVGDGRAERAHRERHDVHRAAPHGARRTAPSSSARISSGSRQLLFGPASTRRLPSR